MSRRLTGAAAAKPFEQSLQSRMRFEVFISKCIRRVNTAAIKTCTNKNQRLIQIGGQFALMTALPITSKIDWGNQCENFAYFLAPTPRFKLVWGDTRAAQQLLDLVSGQFGLAIENSEKLAGDRLGDHRRWLSCLVRVLVDQLVDADQSVLD